MMSRILFLPFGNTQVTLIFDDTCPRYETKDDIVSVDIDHPKHVQQYHVEGMVNQLLGRSNYNSTGENATRTAWVCEQILS